jgi:hypothetical protein
VFLFAWRGVHGNLEVLGIGENSGLASDYCAELGCIGRVVLRRVGLCLRDLGTREKRLHSALDV